MKNWLVAIVMLAAAGCGYTTRSQITENYKTIYIEPFKNKVDITDEQYTENKYRIYRPMTETDITQHVSDRFFSDGSLRPAAEADADLVLRGALMEFRKDPLRYDSNNNVSEYRINLVVDLSLWDNKTGKMLWQERGFTGDTTYFVSGTQAISEDAAMNMVLTDLSRRIVERTTDTW